VKCKNECDTTNNRGDGDYFKVIQKIPEQHTRKEEMQSRIAVGNRVYHANKKLLTNKLLSKNSKMSVHKTIIRPVVTYGSETWMMNNKHEEKLKVF
jgi:hypothetical protein